MRRRLINLRGSKPFSREAALGAGEEERVGMEGVEGEGEGMLVGGDG